MASFHGPKNLVLQHGDTWLRAERDHAEETLARRYVVRVEDGSPAHKRLQEVAALYDFTEDASAEPKVSRGRSRSDA